MKKTGKGLASLMILGALLILFALANLIVRRPVLEYALSSAQAIEPLQEGESEEAPLRRLVKAEQTAQEELAECVSACALGAVRTGTSVSTAKAVQTATLYAVGEDWFEVYPQYLAEGRLIGADEQEKGDQVIVLDEELAFQLFGAEDALEQKVTLSNGEYTVIGLIRHRRSVGEMDQYTMYIPFLSAAGMDVETVMVGALPIEHTGAAVMFENSMVNSFVAGGCFYSIEKEVMRSTMVLRVFLLVAGLYALFRVLRLVNHLSARWIEDFRVRLTQQYMRSLVLRLCGLILLIALCYGALIGCIYLLLDYSIQPLYQFTEWVPENLVEWNSWKNVFWNLMREQDRLVSVGTRSMNEIGFYATLIRWGSLAMLMGSGLSLLPRGRKQQ